MILLPMILEGGAHTIDFRLHVDNAALTWTDYQTAQLIIQLGA